MRAGQPGTRSGPVVVLAGGTGGAKLARGMLDILGEELVVIANTGDDIEVHGAYVCPDPDLICFRLADVIDERGWGIAGDTFEHMKGIEHWFSLGDRDRAIGMRRLELLQSGATLTETIAELVAELGIAARVLPMSDAPVRTEIRTGNRWIGFQEFMVALRAQAPIEDVRFRGADAAEASPSVLDAVARASAIVIGPSNPIASIGPILAVCGAALRAANAPIVAVSPFVRGRVLKGPTAAFMRWAGLPTGAAGVIACYGDLLSAIACDEPLDSELPTLVVPTDMSEPGAASALADRVLRFAESLR